MPHDLSKICLIAVHYRNFEQTVAFLDQIKDWGIQVLVADNSAAIEPLVYKHPNIQILSLPQNPGYFGAVHLCQQALADRHIELCIVSNTDIVFAPDFLNKLTELEYSETTAVIAPRILSSISGNDLNPMYLHRPTVTKMRRLDLIFSTYLSGALWQVAGWCYAKFLSKPKNQHSSTYVYAPHGSVMIFTHRYFESGQNFAYPIFLYGEEMWVAENCKALDLKISYEPSLMAKHLEHGSLGIWPSRRVWQAHKDSNTYILQKFFC